MNIIRLPALCLIFPAALFAADFPPPAALPERDFDISLPQNRPAPPAKTTAPAHPTPGTVSMSKEELLTHPELLQRALDSSLALNHIEAVRFLLPLYLQLPQTDPILVLYAKAALAHADGDVQTAISDYRQILAQSPELTPIRLKLAIALFGNHDNIAATDQFEKIRSEENLPPQISEMVNQYLAELQNRQSWSFHAGVQYLQENNINNAPSRRQHGIWSTPEAQSARGIAYQFDAQKTFPIKNGWSAQVQWDANGKTYWDNHPYDELTLRLYGGIGYRNLRNEVSILPFYEKKRYGGKPYATTPGIRIQASRWMNPRWQVLGAFEYGRKIQNQYKYLNGNSYLASGTLVYLASPKQYWLGGADAGYETAQDKDSSYHRIGIRGGWGQEWGKGISTSLLLGAAKRRYQDKAFATNEIRQDTEYFVTASIWLRNLHFYGLTPRLTASWQRYESNHFMYNYQKNKVFVEVSRKF